MAYQNRTSLDERIRADALDGDHYCALTLFTSTPTIDEKVGEVPVTLSVAVTGGVTGGPQYASKPKQSANDQQSDDDGGVGWGWIVSGLVVLAALIAGLLAAFRRRRDGGATTVDG